MSKKSLILVVSLVLALTMGLGGTLAFFTDRDSETNIFTVGNVDIDLTEDFEQGAELVPGKDIEKKPVITNVGNNDAYVWMTVAVPAGLESSDASDNIVHWNWMAVTDKNYMNTKSQADVDAKIAEGKLPEGTTIEQIRAGQNWTVEGTIPQGQETIDGVTYNVYLMKYNDVLQPGETTLASLHNVYMDPHVDIDPEGNLAWVENGVATDLGYNLTKLGNPKIYVAAYGIQAEGFADVDEAYEAYGIQWGENGGVDYGTTVKAASQDELAAAIADGASIVELGEGTFTIPNEAKGKEFTIIGTKDTVIDATASYGQKIAGADITLIGVTVKGQSSGNYAGFTHINSMSLNNCDVEGKITLYAETEFNNCTLTNMNDYNVWTWGGKKVAFNDCTFVTGGKALLVYGGASADCKHTDVTVSNCEFKSDASLATDKAAIEVGTDYADVTYDIAIEDTTVESTFGTGKNTTTNVWGNKNSMSQDTLNVVIDGVDVH